MKQRDYTARILTAEPGCALTEVADVEIMERTLAEEIWLGVNDDPTNWREVGGEELAQLRAEQSAALEAEMQSAREIKEG